MGRAATAGNGNTVYQRRGGRHRMLLDLLGDS